MKINYVVWSVGYNGSKNYINNVNSGVLEVNKFNVGCCMEKFYEDMDGFSWSENSDGYNWNEEKGKSIVVENVDGDERWVFGLIN